MKLILLFSGVKEYCSTEIFDIGCGENEAIIMQSAIFGRMQPGRCISGKHQNYVISEIQIQINRVIYMVRKNAIRKCS